MGGTSWSDATYESRKATRKALGIDTFAYTKTTESVPRSERKAHETLNPYGVNMRESRDSEAHPESLPIAIVLDVTGSMREVPKIVQESLKSLMGLLMAKGWVEHPQILISAIGDVVFDVVPLQVGQFESGIEIEDNLTNLYLEGGGGGNLEESYDLALYFLARHTVTDAWEKRGKKGYVFIVGDEPCPTEVDANAVKRVIGDDGLQDNIPTKDIVAELQERYHVYFINPKMTSHFGQSYLRECWTGLLGQNFLELEDAKSIAEFIASTVAIIEGVDIGEVSGELKAVAPDKAESVSRALATVKTDGGTLTTPSLEGTGLARV